MLIHIDLGESYSVWHTICYLVLTGVALRRRGRLDTGSITQHRQSLLDNSVER